MSENGNDFEALLRLLALKRHEVPPPGYFEDFSSSVIGRIRAAQSARGLPWLLRALQAFETRPAYPVALASALCLLLLFGIVSVEQSPELVANPVFPTDNSNFAITTPDSPGQPAVAMANTNPPPILQLFATQPDPSASFQQASFSAGGN